MRTRPHRTPLWVSIAALGFVAACGPAPSSSTDDYLVPGTSDPNQAIQGALDGGQVLDPRPDPAPDIVATYGWDIRPCQVEEQLPEKDTCVLNNFLTISIEVAECDPGEFEVNDIDAWSGLLYDQCSFEGQDPLDELDWSEYRLMVSVGRGVGCSAVSDTLWTADCADGVYWGYYFYPCGFCDREFTRLTAVRLPRTTPVVVPHYCVPDVIRCIQ